MLFRSRLFKILPSRDHLFCPLHPDASFPVLSVPVLRSAVLYSLHAALPVMLGADANSVCACPNQCARDGLGSSCRGGCRVRSHCRSRAHEPVPIFTEVFLLMAWRLRSAFEGIIINPSHSHASTAGPNLERQPSDFPAHTHWRGQTQVKDMSSGDRLNGQRHDA